MYILIPRRPLGAGFPKACSCWPETCSFTPRAPVEKLHVSGLTLHVWGNVECILPAGARGIETWPTKQQARREAPQQDYGEYKRGLWKSGCSGLARHKRALGWGGHARARWRRSRAPCAAVPGGRAAVAKLRLNSPSVWCTCVLACPAASQVLGHSPFRVGRLSFLDAFMRFVFSFKLDLALACGLLSTFFMRLRLAP